MTKPGHGHRTKVCPRCGKSKTVSARNFTYTTRRGKRYWKHCRLCDHEIKRRDRERINADPEKVAARRAYKREWQRRKYATNPEPMRKAARDWKRKIREQDPERAFELLVLPKRFTREGRPDEGRGLPQVKGARDHYVTPTRHNDVIVPAGPLAEYLTAAFPDWSPWEISVHLRGQVSERYVRALLTGENEHVMLAAVDRVVTAGLGRPDLLHALYPDGSPHA